REIEGEETQDLHLVEERGLHFHENFDIDEETRFSSVARGKALSVIFNLASHHSPTISNKDTLSFGANSTCQAYTKTPNFSSWNCMQCLQAECAFFSSSSGEVDVYTLSRKWKELVDKARAKQLQPHEYST
ncbi:hypothetical protein S245_048516, partial [Arachis hypogaea]